MKSLMNIRPLPPLALALLLGACQAPAGPKAPQPSTAPVAVATAAPGTAAASPGPGHAAAASTAPGAATAKSAAAAIATVAGRVLAPAGLLSDKGVGVVANNGGAVIANNGAGVIANNGAGVVSTGGARYGLAALKEAALGATEVFLADGAGKPVAGVAPVLTDADGRFRLEKVPAGAWRVMARVRTADGKAGALETLVSADAAAEAKADVDVASTFTTAALVAGTGGKLAGVDAGRFGRARARTAEQLEEDELPDFGDPAAVSEFAEAMRQLDAELDAMIDEMEAEMAKAMAELDASLAEADRQREEEWAKSDREHEQSMAELDAEMAKLLRH